MNHLFNYTFHRHYFWQRLGASELGELYLSVMLKTIAFSLVGIFIPIFLWQSGYSMAEIAVYHIIFLGSRIPVDILSTKATLWYGPKHMLRFGYILSSFALLALATLEQTSLPLPLIALMQGVSLSTFFIPLNIDFTSVSSNKKQGKDIGKLHIAEKIAGAMGPLIGGLIAATIGIEYTIYVSIAFMLAATLPLFASREAIETRRSIHFRLEDYRRPLRHTLHNNAIAAETMGGPLIWPLFVAIFVFTEDSYAGVGVITSASLLVSVAAVHWYGKLIDQGKAQKLLTISAGVSSFLYAIRSFANSAGFALGINVASEQTASGIRMPYLDGMFREAKEEGGERGPAHIAAVIAWISFFRVLVWVLILVIDSLYGTRTALEVAFFYISLSVLGAMVKRPSIDRL